MQQPLQRFKSHRGSKNYASREAYLLLLNLFKCYHYYGQFVFDVNNLYKCFYFLKPNSNWLEEIKKFTLYFRVTESRDLNKLFRIFFFLHLSLFFYSCSLILFHYHKLPSRRIHIIPFSTPKERTCLFRHITGQTEYLALVLPIPLQLSVASAVDNHGCQALVT